MRAQSFNSWSGGKAKVLTDMETGDGTSVRLAALLVFGICLVLFCIYCGHWGNGRTSEWGLGFGLDGMVGGWLWF